MGPVAPLSATPYALTVANNSITPDKMATDYVGSISVNGQKVSAKASNLNFQAGEGLTLNYDPLASTIIFGQDGVSGTSGKGSTPQSVMTTLGDLIYGGSPNGSNTRLPGNTTTWNSFDARSSSARQLT